MNNLRRGGRTGRPSAAVVAATNKTNARAVLSASNSCHVVRRERRGAHALTPSRPPAPSEIIHSSTAGNPGSYGRGTIRDVKSSVRDAVIILEAAVITRLRPVPDQCSGREAKAYHSEVKGPIGTQIRETRYGGWLPHIPSTPRSATIISTDHAFSHGPDRYTLF
ncbi:hypothetical protein EVAR_85032_1 [Eumeta japonica]|uniref:Uncharacterized protein n=1 Tax=Eumeta variegata TaxID=151549 RepID=A0A4C1W978_EUMVA|nr:hypothetical protein EVAR_85032_1 [Eumeta japonica]